MEISHVIEINGKEYHLSKVTFDVYKLAMMKFISGDGQLDTIGAGEVIFKACYIGNNGTLEEISDNVPLYANICLQASSIIEFFEGNIKKN